MSRPATPGPAPRVGVLALQGGVVEHERVLTALGADPVRVRRPADLAALDALVLPGGESSTLSRLLDLAGLREPLRAAIAGELPTLGTCAGLVLLAARLENPAPGQRTLGLLDITARRNAFGPQVASTEAVASWRWPGAPTVVRAAAIRAPEVTELGVDVEVLSRLVDATGEHVVGVRAGHVLALALHPELVGDPTAHTALLDLVAARRTAPAV